MKTYYPGNLGGNDRRFNRNPNSYDSGMGNRQPGMYRKNGMQRKKGPDADTVLAEGITAVKDSLREIIGFQQRLAESQDRIAKAQESHAQAMQLIAACVKHFLGKDLDLTPPEVSPTEETIPPLEDDPMPVVNEAVAAAPETDGEPVVEPAPEPSELLAVQTSEETETEENGNEDRSAEPALRIIADMRENGYSYEKIAEHLDAQGVPHASGNGKWTRWTVSKLFKEAFL